MELHPAYDMPIKVNSVKLAFEDSNGDFKMQTLSIGDRVVIRPYLKRYSKYKDKTGVIINFLTNSNGFPDQAYVEIKELDAVIKLYTDDLIRGDLV
jgi:hypothetical protein